MASNFSFTFHGRGTSNRKDLVFLNSTTSMTDDPLELFEGLKSKNKPAWDRYNKKFSDFLNGTSLAGNQWKPIEYKGTRWYEFKDISSQSRIFMHLASYTHNNATRTACILFSGFDGKKENKIDKGHLIRAKARISQINADITSGDLQIGGWNEKQK